MDHPTRPMPSSGPRPLPPVSLPGRPARSAGRNPPVTGYQGPDARLFAAAEPGEDQAGSAARRPGGLASASRRWAFPGQDLGGTGAGDLAARGESSSGSALPSGVRENRLREMGREMLPRIQARNDSTPRARAGGAWECPGSRSFEPSEARWPRSPPERSRPRRKAAVLDARESWRRTGRETTLLDRFEGWRRWIDRGSSAGR